VPKEKIAADGDYNLSGERYREGEVRRSNYPTVPIGDICELFNGRAFKPEDWEGAATGGIPIVRIQNLNNPDSSFNYFTGEVSERNTIKNGELLFSWSGSRGTSFGAHIWNGGKAVLNQHIFKVCFDESKAIKMYLLHALNRAVTEVEENLHGGVGLVHITKGDLEKIKIPLPPLEVQKEIVAEIEGYQKVIDGARAVLDNYRPHIPIHPDWPIIQLGEICSFKNGMNFNKASSGHLVKIIGVSDFQSNLYAPLANLQEVNLDAPIADDYLVKGGDILFVRSNGNPDLVGRSVIVPPPSEPTTFSGFTIRGRIGDERALPLFYAHFFKSRDFAEMMKTVGQGANIRNLSQGILNALKIPLPPLSTQQAMVAEIEAEQALVAANRELITRFEKKIQATLARVWGEP
jgi:type I restriction enzyme M protein